MKSEYISPLFQVFYIQLENGIVTGSPTTLINPNDGKIFKEDWLEEPNVSTDYDINF